MQPQLQQTLTNTNNCTLWHSTSCSGDARVYQTPYRVWSWWFEAVEARSSLVYVYTTPNN